jgi:hypothetical protein
VVVVDPLVCHAKAAVLSVKVCTVLSRISAQLLRMSLCATVATSSRSEFVRLPVGLERLTTSRDTDSGNGCFHKYGSQVSPTGTKKIPPMPCAQASEAPTIAKSVGTISLSRVG